METENRSQAVNCDGGEEKKNFRGFFSGLILGILISISLAGSIFIGRNVYYLVKARNTQAEASASEEPASVINTETLQKMKTVEAIVNQFYYGEEVTEQELEDGIYRGMIEALNDPYSEYYSKQELQETLDGVQGISYGIGATIGLNEDMRRAMIVSVLEDTPAQEAGLREGDIIYKVDGTETKDMSVSKVVSMVKGPENTTVNITIYRDGELLDMEMVRKKLIETETVAYGMMRDVEDIGYIYIREFDSVTVDQFNEAMAELRAENMKALVLDLRGNHGGDLVAVTEIARRLLPEGLIVYTEDKAGKRTEYTCDGEYEITIPMVVLVNQYSASAAEILAGAIQDHNKGTLIGTKTFGKGIVQRIHKLEDGTALKLTVSAYFTPSGKNIHGIGIEPDIELEYDYDRAEQEEVDNQVEKAIEVLEGQMKE